MTDQQHEKDEQLVPPGTDAGEATPNPAGIVQPEPPEAGPNADPDTPDPADLAPGLGGDAGTRPPSSDE
jgi:hypothetical protein